MAGTNNALLEAIEKGSFREDFYYRLSSDKIETPTLESILEGNFEETETLVRFIATRIAGPDEVDDLTEETIQYIKTSLPRNYNWLGDFRVLEHCVRKTLVHKEYHPHASAVAKESTINRNQDAFANGAYTLNQLIETYVAQEYRRTPNMFEMGMRLRADPRTIKKYLNQGAEDRACPRNLRFDTAKSTFNYNF